MRRAFTLIELLVVVAIISLLISIVSPSLSRAREQAKATVCAARLNEMVRGLTAYSTDHAFALPPLKYEDRPAPLRDSDPTPPTATHGWAEALYSYLYREDFFPFGVDYPAMRNYSDRYDFFTCKTAQPPAGVRDSFVDETDGASDTMRVDYGDDNFGHFRPYEFAWSHGALEAIKPRMPLMMDNNPQLTLAADINTTWIDRERLAGVEGEAYIDERHHGGANYAFPDGHAERSTGLKEELALDWDLNPRTENEDMRGTRP